MVMRYRGGGVGHKSTRDATNKFLTDRDRLDVPTANNDTDSDENIGEEGEEVTVGIIDGEDEENVCAVTEVDEETGKEIEPDPNEDNDESEDDEDGDQAKFEEEFDYGMYGSDNEDEEEADEADDDVLGPEDGEEEDDDDLGYADL
jgi:hypothetical protein